MSLSPPHKHALSHFHRFVLTFHCNLQQCSDAACPLSLTKCVYGNTSDASLFLSPCDCTCCHAVVFPTKPSPTPSTRLIHQAIRFAVELIDNRI
ncbi:hypothetical protein Syun_023584 [Stephania yunnanensis]|uniref:Uncharacterized protein n=1 Tax=Stephania yunnanensis TaxID=152371 RepID=A0AAP0FNB5_9MAGN